MSNNKEQSQKGFLWRLHTASSKSSPVSVIVRYCGHESTAEQLEGKLWQYAEGSMLEGESERFWEQVKECKYCLHKLSVIQKAMKQVNREKGYSLVQIKDLIKKKSSLPFKEKSNSKILQIALNWVKDSLELISTSGSLLTPEPIPVIRGTAPKRQQIIRIDKEFEKCSVELTVQQVVHNKCNIEVKIFSFREEPLPKNIKVNLFTSQRLLSSFSLVRNEIYFDNIAPGNYRIELREGAIFWGQILLDIN